MLALSRSHASTTRAWSGPTLARCLGDRPDKDAVLDKLFDRLAARLAVAPPALTKRPSLLLFWQSNDREQTRSEGVLRRCIQQRRSSDNFMNSWDMRDPDRGAAVIAEDCAFEDIARGEQLPGKEAYKADYYRWCEAFPDGICRVEECHCQPMR